MFGHNVVARKSLLTVCIPYRAVHHLWENDQDYHFVVLCNINLCYDNITGHEVKVVFVWSIAVISVPGILSEFINNHTHSMGKDGGDTFPPTLSPLLSPSG